MKKLILLPLLVLSFHSFGAVTIISDLDDTIKITNAGNFARASWNGVFKEKVFLGIPEFLEEARSYADGLHVVTASPSIILPDVIETLSKNNIKYESLSYRSLRRWESSVPFKVKAIQEILDKTGHQAILMGDDVNHDPEVYDEILKSHPDQVAAIYIHVIEGRELPETSTPYWTTFDLAVREHIAGRMSSDSVEKVLSKLLSTEKMKSIFPKFAQCPSSATIFEWQLQTIFQQGALELTNKIAGYCRRGKG